MANVSFHSHLPLEIQEYFSGNNKVTFFSNDVTSKVSKFILKVSQHNEFGIEGAVLSVRKLNPTQNDPTGVIFTLFVNRIAIKGLYIDETFKARFDPREPEFGGGGLHLNLEENTILLTNAVVSILSQPEQE